MSRCRHCRRHREIRRRGLCSACYYRPAIRGCYLPTSQYAPNKHGQDFNGGYATPDTPTAALPCSPAEIAVLAERAAQRRSLWHPDDTPDWARARPGEVP